MKQVVISINGRDYDIACEEGQEPHLQELAAFVDERMAELVSTVGHIGDMRLLILASLLIADELHEVKSNHERDSTEFAQMNEQAHLVEVNVANTMDTVSDRIEALAARLSAT